MKYTFQEETILIDGINYPTYGIKLFDKEKCIRHIPDVFTDKIEAAKFISMCNKNGLSPIHLDDFINDYIGV